MIIKATRVRTRGTGLQKLLAHVENAEDNEEIVVLRGKAADLLDARADARSFGMEFCVRQWIVSPSRAASFETMLGAVDSLAAEFKFDPAKAYVRGHRKAKADESLFDGHLHILVPEVLDPVAGGVLSSSHDWLRGEKVAKILSFDWGEPFVESAKPGAILAALKRDGRGDVAAAYSAAFPTRGPRPVQSFDTASQQRLKREGLDLPALRVLVANAVDRATNRSEVEANLSSHGLVCKAGDKRGVYMVETMTGVEVGSLSRLAKVKKAELTEIMERLDARPAEKTYDGGSYVPQHAVDPQAVGADQIAGGSGAGLASAEPRWDDLGCDEPVTGGRSTDHREAGQDHRTVGSAVDRKSCEGDAEGVVVAGHDFRFALSLVPHTERLHVMLGAANHLALSQEQRVVVELGEIEESARRARALIDVPPPESATLTAARTALTEADRRCRSLQTEFEQASSATQNLQNSPSWWRLAVGFFTGANAQRAKEIRSAATRQKRIQVALTAAATEKSNLEIRLVREQQRHKDSVREHVERWTKEATVAEARAANALRAQDILCRLPGAAALGAAGLCAVAEKFAPPQFGRQAEADDADELILAAQP